MSERFDDMLTYHTVGMGLEKPTHIQRAAVPTIMEGNDVYVVFTPVTSSFKVSHRLMKAETGSGKTLAFLLPIIQALGTIEPKIDRSAGTYGILHAAASCVTNG